MKKVLLASSALALTAGMAAAEVSLSGYAEIGIADNGTDTTFFNDLDVTFTLSGETDGGLSFGATIDLDEVGDDADPAGDGIDPVNPNGSPGEEHSVFVSGDFGTITMGDTDGAFDWAMTEVFWGTTIDDSHTSHGGADGGFGGNGGLDGIANGQVARYDYSFGDFGVALSAEIGDGTTDADAYGIGLKYSADLGGIGLGFGLGYQDGENGAGLDQDITGVSLSADFAGGISARLNYSTGDFNGTLGDDEHIGVGVAYTMDALLVTANWGESDNDGVEVDGFGVAVNYDLGGGAVVMVGYGEDDSGFEAWSAGLGLSF